MRTNLIIAVSLLCSTALLGLSGVNFAPSLSSEVEVSPKASPVDPPLRRNGQRDFISRSEANLLAARKLVPNGTKSLLAVPAGMRHGDFVWNEDGTPKGEIAIWVDLRRQMISAFRNGHEIGTAVIVYGAEKHTSPEGRFPILNKRRHYHSRTYDAPMPASLFITNDGVALHGSPMSSRRASHGCIGLPVAFAEKLFDASEVGDIVEITRSVPTKGDLPHPT
ncbi:MAG: L,D-transpeptidase family protein [Pseudomonadota bacterium]